MIQLTKLTKTYTTHQRGSGMKEMLKSLFHRKTMKVEALKELTLSIDKGELVGFIGPNGAGKSTTLKILTGVLFPSSGQAEILGMVPWKDRRAYVQHIGAVFGQKSQLIWDIPPMDSFQMNQAIYNVPRKEFKDTLGQLSEMLNVEDLIKQPTRNLSLGERMKCEFIMAMLHRPQIVFLDEPTIGLDVIAKDVIRQFIQEMNGLGTTFILTTHDLADIESLAKRVVVINHGEQIFDDSLENLKSYFGTAKSIEIKTTGPAEPLMLPGLALMEKKGSSHFSYQLDLRQSSLEQLVAAASARGDMEDISIGEIPIERVIKELYE